MHACTSSESSQQKSHALPMYPQDRRKDKKTCQKKAAKDFSLSPACMFPLQGVAAAQGISASHPCASVWQVQLFASKAGRAYQLSEVSQQCLTIFRSSIPARVSLLRPGNCSCAGQLSHALILLSTSLLWQDDMHHVFGQEAQQHCRGEM